MSIFLNTNMLTIFIPVFTMLVLSAIAVAILILCNEDDIESDKYYKARRVATKSEDKNVERVATYHDFKYYCASEKCTNETYRFINALYENFSDDFMFVPNVKVGNLISVFGNSIVEMIHLKWNIPIFVYQVLKITRVGIYFVLFLIILIMYRFISNSKVSLKSHIPGAIIATLGWYVVSLFFSLYIEAYVGFSVVYGNLTTITLAMMWLYICMYFILIGAEFNKILCIEKNKKI